MSTLSSDHGSAQWASKKDEKYYSLWRRVGKNNKIVNPPLQGIEENIFLSDVSIGLLGDFETLGMTL